MDLHNVDRERVLEDLMGQECAPMMEACDDRSVCQPSTGVASVEASKTEQ
jgi:hypothetical protein